MHLAGLRGLPLEQALPVREPRADLPRSPRGSRSRVTAASPRTWASSASRAARCRSRARSPSSTDGSASPVASTSTSEVLSRSSPRDPGGAGRPGSSRSRRRPRTDPAPRVIAASTTRGVSTSPWSRPRISAIGEAPAGPPRSSRSRPAGRVERTPVVAHRRRNVGDGLIRRNRPASVTRGRQPRRLRPDKLRVSTAFGRPSHAERRDSASAERVSPRVWLLGPAVFSHPPEAESAVSSIEGP